MDASSSSGDDDDWEIVSTSSRPRSPSPKGRHSKSGTEAAPAGAAAAAAEATATATKAQALTPAAPPTPRTPLSNIMPGWKDEYLSSILEAERNSPVNQELVDACELGPRFHANSPHLPCITQQEELTKHPLPPSRFPPQRPHSSPRSREGPLANIDTNTHQHTTNIEQR